MHATSRRRGDYGRGTTRANDLDELAAAYAVLLRDAEGANATREGLVDTPMRAAKAWREMTAGYREEPPKLTTFEADYDEIVVVAPIPTISTCEHHLFAFQGHAYIAYLPGSRIVGLSKFARVVNHFSRRLQVQERLTKQIADYLQEGLKPRALGVVIRAEHSCMTLRGVQAPGTLTTTSVMRGAFRDTPEARAEALSLMGLT
jgi:GTP cyclohydrolase I